MQSEQGGNKCRSPERTGQFSNKQKHNNHVYSVKQDVEQVIGGGIKTPQLPADEIGESGDWMPVTGDSCGPCPLEIAPCQSLLNMDILRDEIIIIPGDVVAANGRPKSYHRSDGQQETNPKSRILFLAYNGTNQRRHAAGNLEGLHARHKLRDGNQF